MVDPGRGLVGPIGGMGGGGGGGGGHQRLAPVPVSPVVKSVKARKHKLRSGSGPRPLSSSGGAAAATAVAKKKAKAATAAKEREERKERKEREKRKEHARALSTAHRRKLQAEQELAREERRRFKAPYGTSPQDPAVQSYHSSLSQLPFDAAESNKETQRTRLAAEGCKSKATFSKDPIRLATDGSAVGGGGDGDGGRGGSTEGIGGPQLPGGYKRGDVVYSKINFAFNDLSIAPGDKGVVTGPCVSSSSTAKDRVSVDFENGMRVFASCSGVGDHQITRDPPFDASAFGFAATIDDEGASAAAGGGEEEEGGGRGKKDKGMSEEEAERYARKAGSAAAATVTHGLVNLCNIMDDVR
jgi:hypothetical protein